MTTGQFLGGLVRSLARCLLPGTANDHVLTTDDASPISERSHIFGRGVGIPRVHIARRSAVADKVAHASKEGTTRGVDISDDVERETKVGQDERKEREVGCELEKVCEFRVSWLSPDEGRIGLDGNSPVTRST